MLGEQVSNLGASAGEEVSLKDFRKHVQLKLYNEAGQLVMAFRCWPSVFQALPGPRCQRPRSRDREHRARKRRLGRRLHYSRAVRTELRRMSQVGERGQASETPPRCLMQRRITSTNDLPIATIVRFV